VRERFGPFDYVYTSGYTRTVETADGILAAYPDHYNEIFWTAGAPEDGSDRPTSEL